MRGLGEAIAGLLLVTIAGCSSRVSGVERDRDTMSAAPAPAPANGATVAAPMDVPESAEPATIAAPADPNAGAEPRSEQPKPETNADRPEDAGMESPPREPDSSYLVPASGPCPEFAAGRATFMPDGRARDVEISMSERAAERDGVLLFAWFATAGTPAQTLGWIGQGVIAQLEDEGGIIVAPYGDQASSTRPWYNTPGGPGEGDADLRLMDEVVACARETVGIDVRRIHAIGMSAGGLQTTQVAFRRSGYIASVAIYSGGLPDENVPPDQDPENKFSAMVLYGGASDISPVDGIPYLDASNRLVDLMRDQRRFALLCNHGGGHTVPSGAQQSVWRFLSDHRYGVTPSPYVSALPDGFIDYCEVRAP